MKKKLMIMLILIIGIIGIASISQGAYSWRKLSWSNNYYNAKTTYASSGTVGRFGYRKSTKLYYSVYIKKTANSYKYTLSGQYNGLNSGMESGGTISKTYRGVVCMDHSSSWSNSGNNTVIERILFYENNFVVHAGNKAVTLEYDDVDYSYYMSYLTSHVYSGFDTGKTWFCALQWTSSYGYKYSQKFFTSLNTALSKEGITVSTVKTSNCLSVSQTTTIGKKMVDLMNEALKYQTYREAIDTAVNEGNGVKNTGIGNVCTSKATYKKTVTVDGTSYYLYGPFKIKYINGSYNSTYWTDVYFGALYSKSLTGTNTSGDTVTIGTSYWAICDSSGATKSSYNNSTFYIRVKKSYVTSKLTSVDSLNFAYRKAYATGDMFVVDMGTSSQLWAIVTKTGITYRETTLSLPIGTATGNLTIKKQDKNTGTSLSCQVYLQDSSGNYYNSSGTNKGSTSTKISIASTGTTISGLPIGTYTITEATAPDGYKLSLQTSKTVTATVSSNKTASVTMKNTAYFELYFKKVDEETGEAIEGIGFTIYDEKQGKYINENGERVDNAVTIYTSSDGTISIDQIELLNTYSATKIKIKEVASENLYYKANNQEYTLSVTYDSSNKKYITYYAGTSEIIITNEKAYSLNIKKVDPDATSESLTAEFKIKYVETLDDSASGDTTSDNTTNDSGLNYTINYYYYTNVSDVDGIDTEENTETEGEENTEENTETESEENTEDSTENNENETSEELTDETSEDVWMFVQDTEKTVTGTAGEEGEKITAPDKSGGEYKLEGTNTMVISSANENILNVYYVPEDLDVQRYQYEIKYYFDGVCDESQTISGEAMAGVTIDGGISKSEYVLDTENTDGTSIEIEAKDDNSLNIYYVKGYNYTIKFYYDGTENESEEITGTLADGTYFPLTDTTRDGYELKTIKLNGKSVTTTSVTISNEGDNLLELYYVSSDDSEWLGIDSSGKATYSSDASTTISVTGSLTIKGLKRGYYYIYEYVTPTGYDITQQYNYDSTNQRVVCGIIAVGVDSTDTGLTSSLNGSISNNGGDSPTVKIYNYKFVKKISGFVWVDAPIGKANVGNNLYDESDSLLGGIEVKLYSVNSDQPIATTSTLSNGTYKFILSRQVKYWDLADYYIQFTYNNKEYIVLDPFVTGDDSSTDYDAINSKAQEEEMLQDELEDKNLTGEGYAVTIKNASKLTTKGCLANYYSNDTYEITGINLGLLKKVDPTYSVTETLSYAYIEMNGYTYTYYFDGSADESRTYDSSNVPTVAKQTTSHTYSVSVYPSDIAATKENAGVEMKVYVVYNISIYNSMTLQEDDNYYEQTLYLTSLTNEYDSERFELSSDNSDSSLLGSSDFGLWSDKGSGSDGKRNAEYDVYNSNSAYNSGIAAGNTIFSYIQFQVTQTTLEKLLARDSTLNQNDAASIATAEGFHEYQRTDNMWVQTTSSAKRKYSGCIGNYNSTNDSKEYYYTHKSEPEEKSSGALSINLQLTSERMISGVVYQDVSKESTDSSGNEIQTGNGIIDDEETNRGQTVTVKLLSVPDVSNLNDYDNYETATLYQLSSSDSSGYKITEAECKTTIDEDTGYGYYEFVGIIPGYYYIEFTYGDGSQEIVDTNGNVINQLTSDDYRSTIINTDGEGVYIQNAMEENYSAYDTTYSTAQEVKDALIAYYSGNSTDISAQKIAEWYKYLNNTNYNTAVDNLSERAKYDNYTYTEVGIYDENGDMIVKYVYNTDGKIDTMVDVSTGETIGEYVYDSDGNLKDIDYKDNNSYPYTVNSYTPLTSISIENDKETYRNENSTQNTHEVEYSGFNFGVVTQPKSETIVTKTIENIDITVQNGSTLVSCNIAQDEKSKYVSILDSLHQYVKVEMDSDLIYGSGLEVTYKIETGNDSEVDYLETDSNYYGYYYKYGIVTSSAIEKTITVNEVIDDVDEKYDLDVGTLSYTTSRTGMTVKSASESDSNAGTTTTTNSISIDGWGEFSRGETASITYTVSSLLNSNNEDTLYDNVTRVTSISLTKLTTLTSNYIWGERSKTQFTIYPSTGGDMRNILIISGVIGLIVISVGFVLIKKKVLK